MISANNVTYRVGKKALFEEVNIKFTEGNPCKLRVPLKAYQIEKQKENFEYFCNEIKTKVIQ